VAVQQYFLSRDIPTRMVCTGKMRQPGFVHIPHRAPPGGLANCDRVTARPLSPPTHRTSDDVGQLVDAVADWAP